MPAKNINEEILVVDDDDAIRWMLREALQSWGFVAREAASVAQAVNLFKTDQPAAVLLDIDLPDGSGLDALREIKREHSDAVVIMITGNVQVENTISALRGGAYDFIGKPINLEELRVTIRNAIEARQLRREVEQVRKERAREFNFRQIVGESPAMKKMLGLAAKVAECRRSCFKANRAPAKTSSRKRFTMARNEPISLLSQSIAPPCRQR
jgi:DNA-binding NtrC family response regulator